MLMICGWRDDVSVSVLCCCGDGVPVRWHGACVCVAAAVEVWLLCRRGGVEMMVWC